jgi:transposase
MARELCRSFALGTFVLILLTQLLQIEVYVPAEEDEALRDLVRVRSDAQNAHKKAKQQLAAFLLRYHIVYSGKSRWSKVYFNWLSTLSMKHPGQQITLQDYIDTVHVCNERVKMLTE